jgi:hypothetical protein
VSTQSIVDSSVTTEKLADGAITTAKISDGAVTSTQLADGAVTASKIAPGAISGTKLPLHVVTTNSSVAAVSVVSATAACPAGSRAFGGGVTVDDASMLTMLTAIRANQPTADGNGTPTGWTGTIVGLLGLPGSTAFHVYAICG